MTTASLDEVTHDIIRLFLLFERGHIVPEGTIVEWSEFTGDLVRGWKLQRQTGIEPIDHVLLGVIRSVAFSPTREITIGLTNGDTLQFDIRRVQLRRRYGFRFVVGGKIYYAGDWTD